MMDGKISLRSCSAMRGRYRRLEHPGISRVRVARRHQWRRAHLRGSAWSEWLEAQPAREGFNGALNLYTGLIFF